MNTNTEQWWQTYKTPLNGLIEKLLGKKFADCPEIGPDLLHLARETVDNLVVFFTNKADQFPARQLKALKDQYKAFFKRFLDIFVQEDW